MRPRISLLSISAAAAMLMAEQVAWGSDTIWELLRNPDPANRRSAAGAQGPKPVPTDPRTGLPLAVARGAGKVNPKRRGMMREFERMGTTLRRLGKSLNCDLKVQGQKSIGLHFENVSGSGEAYQNDVYYGRRGLGGTYDQTDLTVIGKLFGLVNFETRYSNNLYGNPYDNRVSLNYVGKHVKLDAGDINGSISGNSLIDFNRTLQGIQFSTDVLRHVRLTGLVSQTKAETRTITMAGNNGPGPYPVFVGQIVDGSERVRVNNQDKRKGEDYTLDPYTGELRFTAGTIITEADTIAITFETYGYNQTPGVLTGYRADVDLLRNTRFGLTYLAQTAPKAGSNLREKTDQFYGYENPQTPYTLSFPVEVTIIKDASGNITGATPIHPMTVTVGTELKTYGVDYLVDPLWPNRVYFRVPIPSTTVVRITYTPTYTDSAPGDRSVMGADATVMLGKVGTISAEMASSKLSLSGKGIAGGAWQIRSDLKFLRDRLHLNWNVRDIGSDFTAIESPGFRRNERGVTLGMDYAASSALKFTANVEKTKRPSYGYTSPGTPYYGGSSDYTAPTGQDDYSQIALGATWQIGKAGRLAVNHNTMKTLLSGGGSSSYATDSLTLGYRLKALTLDLSVGRNANDLSYYYVSGVGGSGTSQTLSTTRSNSLTSRMNLAWRPSEMLTLAAVFANSSIQGLSTSGRTNAQDMQFTADIAPLKNLKLRLGYQLQDSGTSTTDTSTGTGSSGTRTIDPRLIVGRQATGGAYTGTGGLGAGGYNSGLGGFGNYSGSFNSSYNTTLASYAGRSRGVNAAVSYQPWQSLNIDLTWNSSSSEGAYLYNSQRNDVTLNVGYTLGERFSINGSFSTQKATYIGTTGGASTNLMSFQVRGKPVGRLVANLNYQRMRSDSSFSSGTTGTGTDTGIVYPGGNPYYSGGAGSYSSGATNLDSYGIRLEYPIWRGNNLFIQHDNATTTGFWASDQINTMFGVDFDLGNNMKFTLGWRNQLHISRDTTSTGNYSYRVGSLDADVTMHF